MDAALEGASEGSWTNVEPVSSEPLTEGACVGSGRELRGDETVEARTDDLLLSPFTERVAVDSD